MTTATLPKHYTDLCKLMHAKGTLVSVSALVGWDQETYMHSGGARARAEQSSLLARLVHGQATDPKVGQLLAQCEDDNDFTDASPEHGANLREMRRDYDKATKLPSDLVANLAKAQSEAQDIWKDARANNDFKSFVPALTTVMDLTKEKASCLMSDEHNELYDALLGEYEPGATADEIEAVFTPLRDRLSVFIAELKDNGTPPQVDFLHREIAVEKQHAFGKEIGRAHV